MKPKLKPWRLKQEWVYANAVMNREQASLSFGQTLRGFTTLTQLLNRPEWKGAAFGPCEHVFHENSKDMNDPEKQPRFQPRPEPAYRVMHPDGTVMYLRADAVEP